MILKISQGFKYVTVIAAASANFIYETEIHRAVMNCAICKKKIEQTFLNKVLGAYFRDAKGKRHIVCPSCQRSLGSKEKILEKL
jgi:hypothetical protein